MSELSREQVEYICKFLVEEHLSKDASTILDHDAAQRLTIEQQAGEIDQLKAEALAERDRANQEIEHVKDVLSGAIDANEALIARLAAMTAERDEACGELLVSLDDAPIGSLAGKLVTANRVLRSHLATLQATLQATLAERDAYKAVLQGAEYEQVDKIGTLSVEVAQRIGVTAAHRTKEIVAQLAASQQRVRELELKEMGHD